MVFVTTGRRIWNFMQTNALAITIVVFLWIVLWLGDGQQKDVDIIVATLISGISLFVGIRYRPKRLLPRSQIISASLVFVFVLASLLWSDDAGSTLFSLLRYMDAFLVYGLFYSYSRTETPTQVLRGLIVFGLISLFTAGIVLYSGQNVQIPIISLLRVMYDHHPMISVLLFLYPMVYVRWLQTKKPVFLLPVSVFFLASVLTMSRAGVLIEVLFSLGVFGYMTFRKKMRDRGQLVFVGILCVLCIFIFLLPYMKTTLPVPLLSSWNKVTDVSSMRMEYMRQAAVSFLERSGTGSGLGTFYLQSLRLERQMLLNVWIPHSLFLEQLSDMGALGAGIIWAFFALVIGTIFARIRKNFQSHSPAISLMSGLGCVVVFSMVDIPFGYLLITFVFWMILGVVGGSVASSQTHPTRLKHWFFYSALVGVFLLAMFCYVPAIPFSSFYNPIRTQHAFTWIHQANDAGTLYPSSYRRFVESVHLKNPKVLLELAHMEYTAGDLGKAEQLYATAATYDPFSAFVYYPYLQFLTKTQQHEKVGNALTQLSVRVLPTALAGDVLRLHLNTPDYFFSYDQVFAPDTVSGYASLYYQIGLLFLPTDPNRTEVLWRLANIAYPGYGHLYVEYANLLEYTFHAPERARQFLMNCQKDMAAAGECRERLINGVSEPGSLLPYIIEGK